MRNYKKERTNDVKGSFRNILNLKLSKEARVIGARWYPEAHEIAIGLGKLAGYKGDASRAQVGAGILAALSPQTEWGDNIHLAHMLIGTGHASGQTQINNTKALRILDGEHPLEVLKGRKVVPFYKAIVSPEGDNPTVVDRHASAVYMGRQLNEQELNQLQSATIYKRISGAYAKAAKVKGVHPNVLQAQTWLQWRMDRGIARQVGVRT
tara:strand:+ start:9003 stop:9629 length:627 start_codon:yes stop_codon:yes gene_type:complete